MFELEWPQIGMSVDAVMLEEQEPELCEILWNNISAPLRMACRHPTSTGDFFAGDGRPPLHPVSTGTQANPVGRTRILYPRIKPGSIVYSIFGGYGGMNVFYGPLTEPLPARGAIAATVVPEDMADLVRVGKAVWNAQYITHKLMVMVARRKG